MLLLRMRNVIPHVKGRTQIDDVGEKEIQKIF
jgi:hypothetical protein